MQLIIGNKRYSSWSFRAWLLLKIARIPFKETLIYIRKADTAEKIRQYSPGGRVPVLIDGKVRVWESLAICEYIAEKFSAKGLWPRDKTAKAIARSVSHEMHAGFQNLRQNLPCHFLNRYKKFQIPDEVQDDIARILEIWTMARNKWGKGGPFLFGKFSVADAMYAPVVFRFLAYGVPVDPISRQYMKTIESLSQTQAWVKAAGKETERIAVYENLK